MSYLKQPINQQHVQDRKLEKLQQSLHNMEQQMAEQTALRRKLEEMGELDVARTKQTLERANSRNKILQEEIDRVYGPHNPSPSPVSNKMVEEIISKRTKEFQRSQATKAATIQYLAQERQRILDARNRLKERQENLRSIPSPVGSDISEIQMKPPGSRPLTYRSVHSSDSVVRKAVANMPDAVDRIWTLRETIHKDYLDKRKPYEGELGLDSYKPWQIPDYIMVRKLVEEFVDDFLVRHVPPDDIVFEREMKLQLLNHADKSWHKQANTLSERTAVKLVAEEIVLEVTRQMIRETADEGIHQDVMFKRISGNLMIKETEIQATGHHQGRDPDDEAYDLLTLTFTTLQGHRDHHKKDVWTHSQPMMLSAGASDGAPLQRDPGPEIPKVKDKKKKPTTSRAEEPEPEDEPLESDVHLITHNHLLPIDPSHDEPVFSGGDPKVKARRLWNDIYRRREIAYWKNLQPFVFSSTLSKRCKGITCIQPSCDHTLVAMGAASGDILVLNSHVEPWEVVKFSTAPSGGPVISLAWTMDGSRLLVVTKGGNLWVFLTNGRPASKDELSAMGFTTDSTKSQPYALTLLHSMDAKKNHFAVSHGSLAESEGQQDLLTAAVGGFFPSLTFLTSQVSVCAGMTQGDVLKFDLTSAGDTQDNQDAAVILKPLIQANNVEDESNMTTQGVGVELFRDHRHPIMHLGFVSNLGKMITVDSVGFINIWNYDRAHVTGFDWFFPEGKYKLDLKKIMYSPSSSDRPKVIFSDQGRSKETSQAQIARERKAAEKALSRLKLSDPWHVSSSNKPALETYIYVPPGGAEGAGAMFNVIARHKATQQLSTHVTRVYKPVKVSCSRLLTVLRTPSSEELVFVLLFPEFPPKGAHLMILVLDLATMKLRNFRRDIPLSPKLYTEVRDNDIFSAGVTQVYGPTGSNYLFMTIGGSFSCVSLNSGADVFITDSISKPKAPRFLGLKLDDKTLSLSTQQHVATIGNLGSIYAILYEKNSTNIKVLRLEDGNTHENSRMMSKAFERWEVYNPLPSKRRKETTHCASELRINPLNWSLPDLKHKEAEMRSIILGLPFSNDQTTEEDMEKQKTGIYHALTRRVEHDALLNNL